MVLLKSSSSSKLLLLLIVFSHHQNPHFSISCGSPTQEKPRTPHTPTCPPHAVVHRVECSMTSCWMSSNLGLPKWCIMFSFLPMKKLSTTIMLSPIAINSSTRCDPMNPMSPVTLTQRPFLLIPNNTFPTKCIAATMWWQARIFDSRSKYEIGRDLYGILKDEVKRKDEEEGMSVKKKGCYGDADEDEEESLLTEHVVNHY